MEIEGDSLLIVEATKGMMVAGWAIQGVIEYILSLLTRLQEFTIQHVYKEGNAVANSLATVGLDREGLQCWRKEESFPPFVVALLRKDFNKITMILKKIFPNLVWLLLTFVSNDGRSFYLKNWSLCRKSAEEGLPRVTYDLFLVRHWDSPF